MKVLSLTILLISVTYFVEDGSCGVVDRVSSSVEHGTQAVRDRINGWWSYGKDFLFGDDVTEINTVRTSDSSTVDTQKQGLLGGIYNSVVDGYRAVRTRLHDLLIDQENGKDKGVISTMYDRVNKRISQLKSFIIEDKNESFDVNKDPNSNSDMKALRESVTNYFKVQSEKNRLGEEQVRNEIVNAGNKLQEGFDTGKDRIHAFSQEASRHISDGTHATNEYINDKVNNARGDITESFNNLHENMDDLTEKEKEILNSIAVKLRDRVSNVYSNLGKKEEDLKKLSYGTISN